MISKIIEKVVAVSLQKYLEANQLNEPLQSAYKPFHSCETALVRVYNDIWIAIDKRHCVMLLLLDLSSAFDTVDLDILLKRLHFILPTNGFLSPALALCRSFFSLSFLACRLLSLFLYLSLSLYSKFVEMTIDLSLIL